MPRIEDRDEVRKVNWEAAWKQFYTVENVQPAIKGHHTKDTLGVAESVGLMRNGDCFLPPVIPSAISDSTGVRIHVGQLEGRPLFVEAPKGLFEYVPKWLREVRRKDMIDQSERLLSKLKDRIRKDLTQLSQGVVAVISRVSTEALVNLGLLFLSFQAALTRPLRRQIEKVAPMVAYVGKEVASGFASAAKAFFRAGTSMISSILSAAGATIKARWSSFLALLSS